MKTGLLTPVSKKAMTGMNRISKILVNVSQEEWEFVLKQARLVAELRIVSEEIKSWARERLKRQRRKS